MKKKEQGILTVEASLVLTLCIFFILFLFSFARVYNAQSVVSHGVLQSSDAVALESYLREENLNGSDTDVRELAKKLNGALSVSADSFTSLRTADVPKIAKEKFIYAIATSEAEADKKLKSVGVKDGLAGIDFSGSRMDLGNDDVIVYVNYTIEMQFGFFGMNEISVTKAAKSKTFGDILFGIEVIPEDPNMGSASGGGNYKHGTQVQISATPNYGYKFKKWSDGSTANPRTVTVTGAATYVAVFEASQFGVNLVSSPSAGGSTSGGGIYRYLNTAKISATPAAGYHFTSWSIYSHKDKTRRTVGNQNFSLNIDQSYTCTANFAKNSYTVNVETSGTTSANAYIIYSGRNQSSITALYQTSFKLTAPSINGYNFLGWKEKGSNSFFSRSTTVSMEVPANNITYVACYESTIRTVNFYNYDGSLYATRQVNTGNSLGSSMPSDPKHIGHIFGGWQNFNQNTAVYDNMNVYGSWSTCTNHREGYCNQDHYIKPIKLSSHSINSATTVCRCIVCADCGCYLTYKNHKPVKTDGKYWTASDGSKIYIGKSVWCVKHKSGSCKSYMLSQCVREYPVH